MAGLLARMSSGYGHDPMLVGWLDDNIKFGVRYGPDKPVLALTAGAVLGATLGVETLCYSYEATRNVTPYVSPLEDPYGEECLFSLAWTQTDEAGWVAVYHREDDGTVWAGDPEPWFDLGGPIDRVIRNGWSEPDDFDKLVGWMQVHHHDVRGLLT